MPGFIGKIGNSEGIGFAPETRANLVQENKSGPGWYVECRTLNKFRLDKPFYENEDFLLLMEGVVLNRKTIESKYQNKSFASAIIASYKINGETFFNEFRGSFSGVFYDKLKKTWIIFTDQIGDKQVFFTQNNDDLIFGSEPGFVAEYCKRNKIPLTLNNDAAYMLLTYGFFIENNTLAKEIKKLNAGHYLKIINNNIDVVQYHRFTNEPNYSRTLNEWIDGIDHYFRQAVQRQFEKDIEYGYKHITTLSGGLDSRMTVWTAHELGYTDQLNTTFSQSNYLDETIAKQIATDLKHDWLFKALDHGNFIKNADEISKITYGGGSFLGMAHGKSLYDLINFECFGIMHTGQIGDSIIGTFYKKPIAGVKPKIGDGAYEQGLVEKLKEYIFQYDYPNVEIFALYSRAFTGANQGLLVFQEYTESISPFTDVDFLEYSYSIPVELRYNHKIYFDWILKKHPGAAEYVWEKTKGKINALDEYEILNIFGKKIRKGYVLESLVGAVKRRLPKIKESKKNEVSSWNMNPLDYWIETNKELNIFLEDYFNNAIGLVPNSEIKMDCTKLFNSINNGEKLQVITLLSGVKRLFNDVN
jgi:asparagine synthase (glutamine-hydrolysing)